MARLSKNLLDGMSGGIGKQLVFKQYNGKTVVTKYPDMSNVKPSEGQKEGRKVFAEAVQYAKAISRNPVQKAEDQKKLKPGETVRMPVTFFVDPKLLDDPDAKQIDEITLSYTFYPVENAAAAG